MKALLILLISTSINLVLGSSCLEELDFTVYFQGKCNYAGLVERLNLKLEQMESCQSSGDELLLLLNVENEESAVVAVKEACKDAMDKFENDPTSSISWSDVTGKGEQFDKEYYDGNTFWNQEYQTDYDTLVPGLPSNVLRRDAERVDDLYETVARRAQFQWPEHIPNFENCKLRSAMCCWVSDRQAGDNNGNCNTPYDENCVDADPGDNTDLCAVDFERSGTHSNHIQDGFAIFEDDTEGPVHCHGLAWGLDDMEVDARYKANNLFYVSMSDHMHDRGYVRNVPGAPMCSCVENMPIVTRSDCTEMSAKEFWKFTWSATTKGFDITLDRAEISFNACVGRNNKRNDLESFYQRLMDEGRTTNSDYEEFKQTVVGNNQCGRASTKLFYGKGYEVQVEIPDWSQVFGTGLHYSPSTTHDEYWAHKSYESYVSEHVFYVRRICHSCTAASHKDIIYKRLTPVPESLDVKSLFLDNWQSENNTFGEDFDLFSTFEDAVSGTNRWEFCNFAGGTGFPRECGPTERVRNQWNSLRHTGVVDYAFYVYNDNPHNPAPTSSPTVTLAPTTKTTKNVLVKYFEGYWNTIPDFSTLEYYKYDHLADFSITKINYGGLFGTSGRNRGIGAVFDAYVRFPSGGEWTIFLNSDDGSRLYIEDDELILDYDGLHLMNDEKSGSIFIDSVSTKHFHMEYIQNGGEFGLEVSWQGPGVKKQPIPQEAFRYERKNMPTQAPTKPYFNVVGKFYAGTWSRLPDFSTKKPYKTKGYSTINSWPVSSGVFKDSKKKNKFGLVLEGDLVFPSVGTYIFYLASDDGSKLYVDNKLVVDNDGLHGMREKRNSVVIANAGEVLHLKVEFFERFGGAGLTLKWSGPDFSISTIPSNAWFTPIGDVPTVSPTQDSNSILARYYLGSWNFMPNFDTIPLYDSAYVGSIDSDSGRLAVNENYAIVYDGYLNFPTAGLWTFYTSSDDGSLLFVDDVKIVDNDGSHGMEEKSGTINIDSADEVRHVRVSFFQGIGGVGLEVYWKGPGDIEKNEIPADAWVDQKYIHKTNSPTLAPPPLENNIRATYYAGKWSKLPNFKYEIPYLTTYIYDLDSRSSLNVKSGQFDLFDSDRRTSVGAVFEAYLIFPSAGEWTLFTESDDGSKLYIDDNLVVNNDGLHSMQMRSGLVDVTSSALVKNFRVTFFQRGGSIGLNVFWKGPNIEKEIIPSTAFSKLS